MLYKIIHEEHCRDGQISCDFQGLQYMQYIASWFFFWESPSRVMQDRVCFQNDDLFAVHYPTYCMAGQKGKQKYSFYIMVFHFKDRHSMQYYLETTQLFIHTYWLSRKETANKNKVQKTQVGKISELIVKNLIWSFLMEQQKDNRVCRRVSPVS